MENKSGLEVAVHRLKRPLGGGGGLGVLLDISLSGRKERVYLTAMGALPAWRTGVLLVGTGLGDRSMETLQSPGTHQPADHCWFLMTERGTEQVNHEAVMGAE